MGCDIHCYAEVFEKGTWVKVGNVFRLDEFRQEWNRSEYGDQPITSRNYGLFGWLADVRNYSRVPAISQPRGVPNDVSKEVAKEINEWDGDGHSHSWLLLSEMINVDYEAVFWDRRVTKEILPGVFSGAALADDGEGEIVTLKNHLGREYFESLDVLKTLGETDGVRIVFWFDN